MEKLISQNPTECEAPRGPGTPKHLAEATNLADFAVQNTAAKSHIQSLVRHVAREVNRHKLDYTQLKYVFRLVRERCEVEVPNTKARRLKELPSADELVRFYGVMEDPVHRLIFETLEETGLRISELCNLLVSRIDFKSNLVFVYQGKGKKDRVTVIGNRLREKLQLYLKGRANKYLFESVRHTKFSSRRLEQICERYRDKASISKDLTPHTFRHIWNTGLAIAGLSEERRALLAGHDGEETQKIYTHMGAGGFKDEVIEILDRASAMRRRSWGGIQRSHSTDSGCIRRRLTIIGIG
jgi:integrase